LDKWIGEAILKMRSNKITQEQVAKKVGVRREHINLILSGRYIPKRAEERIMAAIDEIIAERS
jgi:transcriptional regulator with XRE-family HTH domain